MRVWLCPFCEGAHYTWIGDYWALTCPFHGPTNVDAMVRYWDAVDVYNEAFEKRIRGVRPKPGVDWESELEKLRKMYKALMEE